MKIIKVFKLFHSIAHNSTDGFPFNHTIRWICRYHLYLHKNDYTLQHKFQHPKSKNSFVALCQLCLRETQQTLDWHLFDRYEHYYNNRLLLHQLIAYTKHYPVLWHLVFKCRL